jgi:hypothetical protein
MNIYDSYIQGAVVPSLRLIIQPFSLHLHTVQVVGSNAAVSTCESGGTCLTTKGVHVAPNAREWMNMVHRTAPAPTVKRVTIATRGIWGIALWLVKMLDTARNRANYIKLV